MDRSKKKSLALVVAAVLANVSLNVAAIEPASATNTNDFSGLNQSYGKWHQTIEEQTGELITFEDRDGIAYIQGDIILGKTADVLNGVNFANPQSVMNNRTASEDAIDSVIRPGTNTRWPDGVVPYTLDSGLSSAVKQQITYAMDHWSSNTAVTFVQRSGQSNYVHFQPASGICSSQVGMVSGGQAINLDSDARCGNGATIHEIGHAMGIWHEQSRSDRDNYITIDLSNVPSENHHNFDKAGFRGEDQGSYDFNSIMHYGAWAFSTQGSSGPAVITPLDNSIPLSSLGQRNGLSSGDLASIAHMYPGDTGGGGDKTFTNDSNYTIPDNDSTGITSPIDVSLADSSGTASVSVNIVHTYIGDLKIELITPDGGTYTLSDQSGGSTQNLSTTYSLNTQGANTQGTWKLSAKDLAGQDVGYINSWSLSF